MTARITRPRSQLWTPATRPSHLRPRYPQLHRGMVYWSSPTFGVAGNKLLDVSGGNNHGTMVNMDWTTDTVAGPYGASALAFNGVDKYVDTGVRLFPGPEYSVSYWMRASVVDGEFKIVIGERQSVDNDGAMFGVRSGSFHATHFRVADWTTGVPCETGRWYHVAWTYDSSTLRLFVDGQLSKSRTIAFQAAASDVSYIGALNNRGTDAFHFHGLITDLIVNDRALTDDEIKLLARRPLIAAEAIRVPMVSYGATPTPTFNPAWAMNSTVVAGVNCA